MIITETHVYFYTNYLSNWWTTKNIAPQFVDPITGITFNNTEEAFMWQKSNFFGDLETCYLINNHALTCKHPSEVKSLGRLVKNYNDKSWSTVRLGFMTYVNLLKYQQNPDLAIKLKETGDRVLVEASPVDLVWGCGLDEKTAAVTPYPSWPGQNLLGKALMEVRSLL